MNPYDMPLLDALLQHRRNRYTGFHVPGHRSGKGLLAEASIFREIMSIDLTELTGLDDLHQPEGAIRDAQLLAADCFGAEHTFFLVNGSTVGNLAAILSVCGAGETLIVQRNVHKSVIHGLMLAKAKAVFVAPQTDPESGLSGGVAASDIERALRVYPEAKGVLITNPNYYGMGIDMRELAQLVHRYDKPLLVDEAHGAHYGFHENLPDSALACGADLVVQSTHKMLTAMTMGAMLHIQGNRVSIRAVQRYLAMLQSSSPSYPIMASLDASRKLLHTEGRDWLSRGLGVVSLLEAKLTEQPWWKLLAKEPTPAYATKDPFKVAVTDATGTLSGFQLRDEIEQRGIMTEMADSRYVLFVFSLASEPQDAERLFEALHPIAQTFGLHEKAILPPDPIVGESQTPEEKQSPCSLPVSFGDRPDEAPAKKIALSEAAGAVSAEMVIPYPPGIPVLYPGEPITEHAVRQITDLAHKGARFQGMADSTAKTIRIQHI